MIKARMSTKNGRDIILLGLSYRNVQLLCEGKPIQIDGEQLGLENLNIVIHVDKDETSIIKAIKDAGMDIKNGVTTQA